MQEGCVGLGWIDCNKNVDIEQGVEWLICILRIREESTDNIPMTQ